MDIIMNLSAVAALLVVGFVASSLPRPERRVIRVRADEKRRKI